MLFRSSNQAMHTPKHSSHGPFNMSLFSWVQKMKKSLPLNIRPADFKPISLSLSQSQMVRLISATMANLVASFVTGPSGWSTTTDYCKWKNVDCDGSNCVTSIDLASQSLTGILSSDLDTLTQLTTLSLQGNSLSLDLSPPLPTSLLFKNSLTVSYYVSFNNPKEIPYPHLILNGGISRIFRTR